MEKTKIFEEQFSGRVDSMGALDQLVVIYYMGRLKQLGLIEVDGITITGKGFDTAADAIEAGWRVDHITAMKFSLTAMNSTAENADMFSDLVCMMQEDGYDKMKEKVEKIRDDKR